MSFENPEIKEGINVSKEHPLKEFAQLSLGIVAVIGLLLLILNYSASYLIRYIPFSFEQQMVNKIDLLQVEASPMQARLQTLADDLSALMDLPEGMHITVHYSDEDTVNAFATMGGHVFFYKGLLEKLQSEDALAMVMAHEIAHVKHRHPMTALSKGITLMALGAVIAGASGSAAGDTLIGQSMNIGLLKFSRDQESQSDFTAAAALQLRYQHILGARELFKIFSELTTDALATPALFSSHPHTNKRWSNLKNTANKKGWQTTGTLQPLKFEFKVAE